MRRYLALIVLAGLVSVTGAGASDGVRIEVGRGPCCVVAAAGGVWVGNHRDVTVQRIDARTNAVVQTIRVGRPGGFTGGASNLTALRAGLGALYVINGGASAHSITRVDAKTGRLLTRRLGNERRLPWSLAVAAGSIWVTASEDAILWQLDPRSLALRSATSFYNWGPVGIAQLTLLTGGRTGLWATTETLDLLRIDARSKHVIVSLHPFADGTLSAAQSGTALWVAATGQRSVVRIDTVTNRVTRRVPTTSGGDQQVFPVVLAAGDGTIWLQPRPALLERLDPTTGTILRRIKLPLGRPAGDYFASSIASAAGSLWITQFPGAGGFRSRTRGYVFRAPQR